jgi:multiple sugar transport system substrate-binding protein
MNTFSIKHLIKRLATVSSIFVGLGSRLKTCCIRIAVVAFFLCLAGCPSSSSNSPKTAEKMPLSGIKLKLAVAGDPDMAAAIGRLQGEWNAQTGAEVQVLQITEKELAESSLKNFPADAVICDPRFIAIFAEHKMIVRVPASMQKNAQWADIFDLLRHQEVAWGGEVSAVPFGSPVFVVYYRVDLLEKLNRKPPQTWAEYQELAKLLAGMKQSTAESPWFGTAEPLGPGWAGLVLLARAAPYAKHRDNYSTLFNIKTMEPLLTGPAMVRALEELIAAAKLGSTDVLQSDPAAVRAAFWQGKCGMAIAWPSAAERHIGIKSTDASQHAIPVGFSELPGSNKVYNINNQTWETRLEEENSRVPFLSLEGRVGVVGKESAQQEAAFQLLLWLSSEQNSEQVSPASQATTLFRRSQLKHPELWVEKPVTPVAAAKYGELTAKTLQSEQWLGFNMPGREEYLEALDQAVQSAVRGEVSPADALKKAAERWREITENRGLDQQRSAYLRSLGLE